MVWCWWSENGRKGWHRRRLKILLDTERRLCWQQRIAEATEQHKFTPLHESVDDVFERFNRLSEADLDHLDTLAVEGELFTSLASEIGISSGGWILLCEQYEEFDMLDFELYLMAIKPQIQAWNESVITAHRELAELARR